MAISLVRLAVAGSKSEWRQLVNFEKCRHLSIGLAADFQEEPV
jgi:hypothetical protein